MPKPKNNYYAVKSGRTIGIVQTWDECKKNTIGFKNALYKGFVTRAEAEEFMSGGENVPIEEDNIDFPIAYVDGSYDIDTKTYSFGAVIILPDGEIIERSGVGNDEQAISQRNVAGELMGAINAIEVCCDLGYTKILIKHDYTGIAHWARGEWKANSYVAIAYINYIKSLNNKIELFFEKVPAHSGVIHNERADVLAANAIKAKKQEKD